jgi:hypothetical protein
LVIVDPEKDPRDSGTIDAEREARESA